MDEAEAGSDHLSMAESALGEPDETFRISRARVRAKLWTGIGLIFGSIAVIALAVLLGLGFDAALLAKIILMPMIVGATLLVTMYRQRGLMVLAYPAGLLRLQRGAVVSFPWDEITEVRLKIQRLDSAELTWTEDGEPKNCWLPTEAPSLMVWQASMVLERADGTEAHVSPAIADYDRLVKLVQRRTFPRLWIEARDRLLNGESIAFGDLVVTGAGLKHTSKKLAWKDFKELVIAQGRLTVKKSGGWMPWAVLDVSKVPNPHVLFALVAVAKESARIPAIPQDDSHEK
jgi:hypothetical protein